MSDAREPTVTVRGEELVLLAERALYWPARATLLVADPHFGKAATFRAAAIPVPAGTTGGTLGRLDAVVARTGAKRIVFLGDFLHARAGRAPATLAALAEWRAGRPSLRVTLVRGNHDRHAGDPPRELEIECVDAPALEGPFALVHHPAPAREGYALAGHLHPAATLVGRGRQSERLPCFWFARDFAVLPAFGEFTGLAAIDPRPDDAVFVVADETVVDVTRR